MKGGRPTVSVETSFFRAHSTSFIIHSSFFSFYLLPLFFCLISFVLSVSIPKCLRNTRESLTFPTAILKGSSFARSLKAITKFKRNAIKPILLS